MKRLIRSLVVLFFCVGHFLASQTLAQKVDASETSKGSIKNFSLSNDKIKFTIVVDADRLVSDKIECQPTWEPASNVKARAVETDADFKMEIMWTDWQAPVFHNNAENPVLLSKSDFQVTRRRIEEQANGARAIVLDFMLSSGSLQAQMTYMLNPKSFFVSRKVSIADTSTAGHFLQKVWPIAANIRGVSTILKPGGFGQPVALTDKHFGCFVGLEYPAADNGAMKSGERIAVHCAHECGERIGKRWLESEWAVMGIVPDTDVKRWFMKYVDDIRVAPLKPYTLYNSWYDLRSAEYPKVAEANVMNEANIMRIIGLIKKNMIEKHSIALDAFVLDDGWDVYESDWVLREKQFPNGLKPVSDELKKTNTGLGIWFGPTGGYSFRMKRVDWMRQHRYEVVGVTKNTAMLCLGGENYSALFKKRVTDFVGREGVSYFKWDGIQFSCSEPDHGHPVGIYSRRAILESVIDKCRAVRAVNPEAYLNITSGTWLSPWWVKCANQVWMQGEDYGYADVPSISPRDAAITYRDFVLYDDFKNNDFWFPISNLMTHGVIKGNLQMLGGRQEPLDKFTNEILLYLARGVSMWELYISPDILNDGEWNALGRAMHWAKDRFPILSHTEMIGGDPRKRETYGYVHASGNTAIIAARNPWIEPGTLKATLSTANGFDRNATQLVLERVYPSRWISTKLYKSGETIELPLDGYETAIYEIYPIERAQWPLLAGTRFDVVSDANGNRNIVAYEPGSSVRLLNANKFRSLNIESAKISHPQQQTVEAKSIAFACEKSTNEIRTTFSINESVADASLSLLLTPEKSAEKKLPRVIVVVDGVVDTARNEKSEGASAWFSANITPGRHDVRVRIEPPGDSRWAGSVSGWLVCQQKESGTKIRCESQYAERPMPPLPFPAGVKERNVKLGSVVLQARE